MTPYRASPAEKALSPDEALARAVLAPLMQAEEELVWAQRPKRGFVFHRRDLFLTLFALLWTTISLFWAYWAIRHGATLEACVAIPFTLIGLHLMIFRHVLHARRRASLFYGLTDRRVLVVRTDRGGGVVGEFLLADLDREKTALDFRGGGYTDIWLDERYYEDTQGTRHERMPNLAAVPNGEAVFDRIIEQRAAALRRLGRTP